MHLKQIPSPCLQMVVTRLQSVQRKSARDLLVNVVAAALHYNAEIAVAALQQQGQLATTLSTWFQVIITTCTSAPCCAVLQHQWARLLSILFQVTVGLLPCVLGRVSCIVLVGPSSTPML